MLRRGRYPAPGCHPQPNRRRPPSGVSRFRPSPAPQPPALLPAARPARARWHAGHTSCRLHAPCCCWSCPALGMGGWRQERVSEGGEVGEGGGWRAPMAAAPRLRGVGSRQSVLTFAPARAARRGQPPHRPKEDDGVHLGGGEYPHPLVCARPPLPARGTSEPGRKKTDVGRTRGGGEQLGSVVGETARRSATWTVEVHVPPLLRTDLPSASQVRGRGECDGWRAGTGWGVHKGGGGCGNTSRGHPPPHNAR